MNGQIQVGLCLMEIRTGGKVLRKDMKAKHLPNIIAGIVYSILEEV